MLELSTFQWIILILFVLMCLNYIYIVSTDISYSAKTTEGFEGGAQKKEDESLYTWIHEPSLIYDETYAEMYD